MEDVDFGVSLLLRESLMLKLWSLPDPDGVYFVFIHYSAQTDDNEITKIWL